MSSLISTPDVGGLSQSHSSLLSSSQRLAGQLSTAAHPDVTGTGATAGDQSELRSNFNAFVGQSFYGLLLQQMHKTVGKPAYFHGGRAEEAFQGQLDQVLSEKMAKADGGQFSDAMFDLFNLQMQPH